MLWGAMWCSKNKTDGVTKYLMHRDGKPVIFTTKCEAKSWIDENYGYIKTRKDLRSEPHGWRLPKPVKVYYKYYE